MQIMVKVVGLTGAPAGEQKLELGEGTLADAKKHLVEIYPDAISLDKVSLGVVNGKSVGRDWESVVLKDGDSVMFVVPVSGG